VQEKDWIFKALAEEESQKSGEHRLSAWKTLTDHRVWHLALISFTFQAGALAMSFWIPQAIKSLSSRYSNTVVGMLMMIPYVTDLVVLILVSRSSDRKLERRYHAAIPIIIAAVALLLLGTTNIPWLSIALWTFAAMG